MKKCLSLYLVLLMLATIAQAAKRQIIFKTEGEREIWILEATPDRMPVAGRSFTAKTVPVDVPDGKTSFIVVHDPAAGSVAIRKSDSFEGTWTISDKEWKAANVKVEAFTKGVPLPTGIIELRGSSYERSLPIENGGANFFAVPYGDTEITIKYKSAGADKSSKPQVFRVRKEPGGAPSSIAITITDAVDSTAAEAETTKKVEEPSWWSRGIVWLIALALGICGLFFLMKLLKGKSADVEEKLRSLGVPIPGDTPQNPGEPAHEPFQAAPVVPEGHCKYCGKPDAECICRLDAPKAAPVGHGPEFVGLGIELKIPEGTTILGREAELQIADPTVSRQHASIYREGSVITVTDLDSANGTYVDGVRISEPTTVRSGAVLHFGSIKVRLEA